MKLSSNDLQTLAALPPAEDARVWVPDHKRHRVSQLEARDLVDTDVEDGNLLYARRTAAGDAAVKAAQEEVTDVR